jgi:hypothetical protein
MNVLIALVILGALGGSAFGEPLEKRFGADHQRGYRSDREYGSNGTSFENRDRANFLNAKKRMSEPVVPRNDLQSLPNIGTRR